MAGHEPVAGHLQLGCVGSSLGTAPRQQLSQSLLTSCRTVGSFPSSGEEMLLTLAIILVVLWLLGVVGIYAIGPTGDGLLVFALILLVFEMGRGRVQQ